LIFITKKKVKNNLRFLSAIQFHYGKENLWDTNWKFGYSYKSAVQLRGLIEGNGSVASILEMPLTVFLRILISGKINYPNNMYDFGFGLSYAF